MYCLQSLSVEKEELQKAQVKADHRVSTHKEATQLLQTELQDTCAVLQERERTMEELGAKLKQLETEVMLCRQQDQTILFTPKSSLFPFDRQTPLPVLWR